MDQQSHELTREKVADLAAGSTTESHHKAKCRLILDAARRIFARNGFHSASMQMICASARMSPGALYRYFRSKDEIIAAIAEEEREEAMGKLAAISPDGPIMPQLYKAGLSYMRQFADPDEMLLCAEVSAERLRNSEIGAHFASIDSELEAKLFSILTEAVARDEIRPVLDLRLVVVGMKAIVEGLSAQLGVMPHLTVEIIEPVFKASVGALLGVKAEAILPAGGPACQAIAHDTGPVDPA